MRGNIKWVDTWYADLELPHEKVYPTKKIAETGVLHPDRVVRLSKNPVPFEKLNTGDGRQSGKGYTPNLPSIFSGLPDPAVHGHRLKRRANLAKQVRKEEIARLKEKHMSLVRKKTLGAEARDIQDLARQFAVEALQAMVDILDNPDASDSNKLAAANSLLDRAYGKSPVTNFNVNASVDAKPSDLDEKSLDRRLVDVLSKVEKLTGPAAKIETDEDRPSNLRKYN